MAVDLRWDLLTNASQNFGNALTQAASTIHDRRKESGDRQATANYLNNPADPTARAEAIRRNPAQALQIGEHHLEAARNLRADQQQQLDYIGQILTGVNSPEAYAQALGLARQAGIDVTGHETYDPAFVASTVDLHQRLHPVAPVSVAEGARLVNPRTGAEVAAGNPRPPRYYPVQPGGTLVLDPSYQQPGGPPAAPQPAPAAQPQAASPDDVIAVNPTTGEQIRFNPQSNQWEPVAAGGAASGQPGFPRQDGGAFDFRINPPPGG